MMSPASVIKPFTKILLLTAGLTAAQAVCAAKIETTIPPIHSVTSALLDGIDQPGLLLENNTSPHDFSLKPSHRKRLKQAELIIWAGPTLESSLAMPIKRITQKKDLELLSFAKMDLLPMREDRHWIETSGGHDHGHQHGKAVKDPHFWLDPRRMHTAVDIIYQRLLPMYKKQQATLELNYQKLQSDISLLDQQIRQQLYPLHKEPYLVFHDAWQYLEQRYELNSLGVVTNNPEQPLKLSALYKLKKRIRQKDIQCLFSEPQFPSKSLSTLTRVTDIQVGILDPLGSKLQPGKNHYLQMMQQVSDDMHRCLSPAS